MNRIYRTVFNRALNLLQVASEMSRGDTSSDGTSSRTSSRSDVLKSALQPVAAALLVATLGFNTSAMGQGTVINVNNNDAVFGPQSVNAGYPLEINFTAPGLTLDLTNEDTDGYDPIPGVIFSPLITIRDTGQGMIFSGQKGSLILHYADGDNDGSVPSLSGTGINYINNGNANLDLSPLDSVRLNYLLGVDGYAAYMESLTGNASLVLGNNASLRYNKASQLINSDRGGALFVKAGLGSASIAFGSNTYFLQNSTNSVAASEAASSIYLEGLTTSLSLKGNTYFNTNAGAHTITVVTTAGNTGEFRMDTGADATGATPTDGHIAFQNSTGDIYFNGGSINFTVSGNNNVYLNSDVIDAANTTDDSFIKTGNGILQVGGTNLNNINTINIGSGKSFDVQGGTLRLAPFYYGAGNANKSTIVLDLGASGGTFHLASNATLAGEGRINNSGTNLIEGTVSPDAARFTAGNSFVNNIFGTPNHTISAANAFGNYYLTGNTTFNNAKFVLDVSDAAGVHGVNKRDSVEVTGNVGLTGTNVVTDARVDVLSGKNYTFLSSGVPITGTSNIKFDDRNTQGEYNALTGFVDLYSIAARGTSWFDATVLAATPTQVALRIDLKAQQRERERLDLEWTDDGDTQKWGTSLNIDSPNWTDRPDNRAAQQETLYMDGDRVTFGNIPWNDKIYPGSTLDHNNPGQVTILEGGVTPGSVTFTNTQGHNYLIVGDIGDWFYHDVDLNQDIHTDLKVEGAGAVRLEGHNSYSGGTTINNGGIVSVVYGDSLSVWGTEPTDPTGVKGTNLANGATAGLVTITGNGGTIYASSAAPQGTVTLQNHFEADAPASSTGMLIDIGSNEARNLAITNVINTTPYNGTTQQGNGGAINVVNTALDVLSTNGGTLRLAGNQTQSGSGGAISIVQDNAHTRNYDLSWASNASGAPNGGATGAPDAGAHRTLNLINNSAGAKGGAINFDSDSQSAVLTLPTNTHFQANQAGQDGGAIYATGVLNVNGATLFDNNTSNGNGGAIFLANGAKLNLDAGSLLNGPNTDNYDGGIAFSGNKAQGNPNAIGLAGHNEITAVGGRNIYFDDPIVAAPGATGNSLTVAMTASNSDIRGANGFIQFVGDHVLNPETGSGFVDVQSGT
ncbi:MAG: ESPR domain-containing protein, partial [Burkholderiales bacterium]|nr:ESPR domain-containing protein [Burkholderiales bacterium]